jgi:hypothetical protein
LRLANHARNTGNLIPQTKGVDGVLVLRVAHTPQNEEAVLQAFEEDDTLSIRSAASMFNISKSTTQRIPKDNRQHVYHYTRVQNLLPEDRPLRVQFCEWLLQHAANRNFVKVFYLRTNVFSRETEHLTCIIIVYGQTKRHVQFKLMHINIGLASICGLRFWEIHLQVFI